MLHIDMATHSLKGTFDNSGPQNQWWRHCDVISQSISTKFCIFLCYTKRHLCAKFEQNRTRNKEVAKNGKWRHCDVISKNSSAIFCVWVSFTHTYWCTKFQVDWRSDKGITGGGTILPRAENDQKSPGRIGLIVCVHVIEGRASLTRRIARCTRIRNCNWSLFIQYRFSLGQTRG